MTVRDDLIAEIERIISAAANVGYADPVATNDVYENFVWALCLRAAAAQGALITYQTVHETQASTLVFRTTPGAIYSTSKNYTHAILDFAGCPELELHVGIRVTGRSRVLHECDVAVVDGFEAQLCRLNQVHPRASKVHIAAECKFYTSALQLFLGRGFLGLTSDIYRKERYLVTNSNSSSVTKLVSHHQSEWDFGVFPGATQAEALYHRFARAFRNYKVAWG